MHSVLFVCTANICRSPLAMGLLRQKVNGQGDWQIDSAGTWTTGGEAISRNSDAVLRQRGVVLKDFASQPVTQELLENYQLILTMTKSHKEALQIEFPEIAKRIYLLSEMAGQNYDIDDPYGGPLAEYEITAREIELILANGFPTIASLSQSQPA